SVVAGVLGVRSPRRPKASEGPFVDLSRMRCRARPGPQRIEEHPGGRAGPCRLWSRCKTGGDPGSRRRSRNRPGRCRMSGTTRNPALQGGEEVNARPGQAASQAFPGRGGTMGRMEPSPADRVTCCIAGCGPAGAVLGLLLARSGVDVLVLEKHGDFLRDFRGDTLHPSTLRLFDELGLAERLLRVPH